ncbi:hypothetical protein ACFQ9R_22895 [Nocardia sp. NPDC056541]|uniref:hypothetical protein n=1 Tax=Nocardia sp. NPDC056541 TaxID=3345860 RepID=UPI00366AD71A
MVAGLYLAAMIRLIVSQDWNDVAAARMFGLATAIASLLFLAAFATAGNPATSARDPQKRWTERRTVVAVIVAILVLAGVSRMVLSSDLGDPAARLLTQTGIVAFLLSAVIGRLPPLSDRR